MIFAHGPNGEFGKGSGLPWDIPEELTHFKEYTKGKTLIMSGSTFASLPGLLPGRRHIVIGRPKTVAKNGAVPHVLFPENYALRDICGVYKGSIVVGGRDFLLEASKFCKEASITEVLHSGDADYFIDYKEIYKELNSRLRYDGVETFGKYHIHSWKTEEAIGQ